MIAANATAISVVTMSSVRREKRQDHHGCHGKLAVVAARMTNSQYGKVAVLSYGLTV
jgi:hypothetical protein